VLTPGKIALCLYYRPLGRIRDSLRNGGPIVEWHTAAGRRAMERAAWQLPAQPVCGSLPLELHVLTGQRFWYQTAYCLYSFATQAGRQLRPVIYDDGTLEADHCAALLRLFPSASIQSREVIRDRLDYHLPIARFPALRDRWKNYPNIRKLIDPHLGQSGWKLVIDSDLLFFRSPRFLLDWLAAPDRPLHAVDCMESYGYSRQRMAALAGAELPKLVNVGLCGWRSHSLDWAELEYWCAELIKAEGTNYYLEQALVAMLAARVGPCAVAPAVDYVTKPSREESHLRHAVMHHYVADSKRWYFQENWRQVFDPGQ